jgi:hypothetical protein
MNEELKALLELLREFKDSHHITLKYKGDCVLSDSDELELDIVTKDE